MKLKKGIHPEIRSCNPPRTKGYLACSVAKVFSQLGGMRTEVSEYNFEITEHDTPTCNPEISLLVSDTESEAAETIASWLASALNRNDSVLFIHGPGSSILDAAFHRFGLPRSGTNSRSPWRAATQVLGLSCQTAGLQLTPTSFLNSFPYRGPLFQGDSRATWKVLFASIQDYTAQNGRRLGAKLPPLSGKKKHSRVSPVRSWTCSSINWCRN